MRSQVNKKRISKEILTVDEVVNGYKKLGNKIGDEYRLKVYEPIGENLLIVDSGTYSGIEILGIHKDGVKQLRVFSGGLYFETLYNKDLGNLADINEIYEKLVEEEKINVDIFQMIFICLSDYALRGKN